jgi:hypothetical protein
VIGELGGDELVTDASDADGGAVGQAVAEGDDHIGSVLGEELLDSGRQGAGNAEPSIDGR